MHAVTDGYKRMCVSVCVCGGGGGGGGVMVVVLTIECVILFYMMVHATN